MAVDRHSPTAKRHDVNLMNCASKGVSKPKLLNIHLDVPGGPVWTFQGVDESTFRFAHGKSPNGHNSSSALSSPPLPQQIYTDHYETPGVRNEEFDSLWQGSWISAQKSQQLPKSNWKQKIRTVPHEIGTGTPSQHELRGVYFLPSATVCVIHGWETGDTILLTEPDKSSTTGDLIWSEHMSFKDFYSRACKSLELHLAYDITWLNNDNQITPVFDDETFHNALDKMARRFGIDERGVCTGEEGCLCFFTKKVEAVELFTREDKSQEPTA